MPIKHYNIPIFIPELACPFQCVFCNQRKITGKQSLPSENEIVKTIEAHLQTFKATERVVEVGFFGGSFTGIPMEQQAQYLQLVQSFLKQGQINGIRLSTRPDYIDKTILDLLKMNNVTTIELGAQSLDDEVLLASFRGHTARQTEVAAKQIKEAGFNLGLQMMIGLPGDSLEKSLYTAKRIIELGASNTRIYPTVVIKDTALHKWYNEGKFTPLALEDAVQRTKEIIPLFEEAGVKIIRVGLHPSEGLLSGEELVAGPFHPSFKEIVLTEIWGELFRPLLKDGNSGKLSIKLPPKELNFAIGYKAKNKKTLLKYYTEVNFITDPTITQRSKFQVL